MGKEIIRQDERARSVWDNKKVLDTLFQEFDKDFRSIVLQTFGDVLGTSELGRVWGQIKFPRLNVISEDDKLVVKATVPGYKREDIEVSIEDSIITIRGNVSSEKDGNEKYLFREIHQSAFTRSVSINTDLYDMEQIEAKLEDGILTLVLPKREELPIVSQRKIEIL